MRIIKPLHIVCLSASLLLLGSCSSKTFRTDAAIDYCVRQALRGLHDLKGEQGYDYTREPRNIEGSDTAWSCRKAVAAEWCSGFWPGILWMASEACNDKAQREEVRRAARGYTESLGYLAGRPVLDHDLGFIIYCSYGNGYRLTGSNSYRGVILESAKQLSSLFNPTVGTLLSWPIQVKRRNWPHNTIMDNMMNLEMLFWASKNGGDSSLYKIAERHAETTMKNHFRPDGSCYHVAVYDTLTGKFIKGVTHQGYADGSTWTRGQAWAIYGFTMSYRETGKRSFLDCAQRAADLYLKRLAATSRDHVPAWDFDVPDSLTSKDASAAAITADALLELSGYVPQERGAYYSKEAVAMLASLYRNYRSGSRNCAFLLHSTGHHPGGSEIDASIIYADYYFLEALLRLKKMNLQ